MSHSHSNATSDYLRGIEPPTAVKPRDGYRNIRSFGRFLKIIAWVLIGFSLNSCASLNSTNYHTRIRAVNKITDQNILYKVALEDINYEVRVAAFNRITDQEFIHRLAVQSKESGFRIKAIDKISDQSTLYKIVLEDKNDEVRTAALNRMNDQELLDRLAFKCKEPGILLKVINKIIDQSVLYKIALETHNDAVRKAAMKRLIPGLLAKLATDFKEQHLKMEAVALLSDQTELINIAQYNEVWEVRKAAFKKLNESSLIIITDEVKDPALVLSANIRLGRISWNAAFSNRNNSLNHVVGAAAMVDNPKPTASDVVRVCHNFIRLGDASRIPELIYLLNTFGNKELAEDYMNCGHQTLEDAGCKWGSARGYRCTTGSGSHRVRWGSSRQ